MSVRQERPKQERDGESTLGLLNEVKAGDSPLGEGRAFDVVNSSNPLSRTVVVNIKSSLNDIVMSKDKAEWRPSREAIKNIFQQRKFTSLDGSAQPMGDLKSIVLHSMKLKAVKSTFPIALGAKISGVDDNTFSSTGESFSHIILPHSSFSCDKTLQADDTSLAYEFASKFPGYTGDNLDTNGIVKVDERRFVLVSNDHPIVHAISENADKLQMGEITMMPEGLVKISSTLFDSILPLVKTQVDSQIKVRDLSNAAVTFHPADYASWQTARSELMVEAKRPMKAKLQMDIAAAATDEARSALQLAFDEQERALEHEIDHKPLMVACELGVEYNFLS